MSKKFRGNEAVGGSGVQQDTGGLGPDAEMKNVREISCINMLSIKDAYLAVFVFLSLFFGSLPEYMPLRRIRPVALE